MSKIYNLNLFSWHFARITHETRVSIFLQVEKCQSWNFPSFTTLRHTFHFLPRTQWTVPIMSFPLRCPNAWTGLWAVTVQDMNTEHNSIALTFPTVYSLVGVTFIVRQRKTCFLSLDLTPEFNYFHFIARQNPQIPKSSLAGLKQRCRFCGPLKGSVKDWKGFRGSCLLSQGYI